MFHESPAATADMAALPGVLECRPLQRTVQVRLEANPAVPRDELPGGTTILFALAPLRSVPQAGSQFHVLAAVIHETSGLQIACFPFAATIPPPHQALLALGHWDLYLHDLAAIGATLAFKTVEFIGYLSNLKTAEARLSS